MNEVSQDPASASPRYTAVMRNCGFLVLSIFPVLFSSLLLRTFAPIDGFCPLDIFHGSSSPSEHELLGWRWGSSIVFVAVAIVGIFKRPFAVAVLAVTYISPLLLVLRFFYALSYIR